MSMGVDAQLDYVNRVLHSSEWSQRRKACEVAAAIGGSIGRPAQEALSRTLINVTLNDGDAEVRHAAVCALATFDPEVRVATASELCTEGLRYELESLHSSRRNVKSAACNAMGVLGPECGMPYLQDLQDCLRDKSSLVKKTALAALGAWGLPVAAHENARIVVQELGRAVIGDRDPGVRAAACDALGRILEGAPPLFKPPEAEPEVVDEDSDEEPVGRTRTRTESDEELEPTAVAVRYMVRILHDDDYASVRRAAAAALGSIGGDVCAAQAECLLVAALQDKDKEVRLRAAESLAKLGGLFCQQIAEALAMALEGGREGTGTRLAAEALHSQGPLAAEHTTTLSSALLDVDEDVRELAALTLLATGEASLPCQRRLMRTALNDNASHVQAAAICVLELLSGQLAAADFAAELAAALESDRVSARWGALKALQALGADAVEPYAHQLALLLSDDSWFVRSLATELLLELGPRGAENSQPVLVKALHNLDQEVRRTAAIALGKHGQVASCRASALCTRMLANRPGVKSNDPEVDLSERLDVKTACMWALGQLHPDSVVPLLHHLDDGLFHRNSEYRLAATEALHNLGPAAVEL
eukprot:CAMPEP_0181415498 /NCGR_PEP_ID=MMETSP1110-20121109/10048_1 /TAXON_ID=174948 /ORGANISM="Symbiodinium sp., Strain CCMP421" /LENGTH=591 /DNA_ID=CAMNT_0023538403 /DNA_START=1 /DNA_END=1772 /DNA_ORIENTATION=-